MSDPPSSVSSGSIDLEALRAKWLKEEAEHKRQAAAQAPMGGHLYTRHVALWESAKRHGDELDAVLASLGERRGTQAACRCGVSQGVSHYCFVLDHAWVGKRLATAEACFQCDGDGYQGLHNCPRCGGGGKESSSSCSPAPPQEQP